MKGYIIYIEPYCRLKVDRWSGRICHLRPQRTELQTRNKQIALLDFENLLPSSKTKYKVEHVEWTKSSRNMSNGPITWETCRMDQIREEHVEWTKYVRNVSNGPNRAWCMKNMFNGLNHARYLKKRTVYSFPRRTEKNLMLLKSLKFVLTDFTQHWTQARESFPRL
jgi:hypothetical protein